MRALELFREIPGLSETWFAYHPLFREVLRRELERTTDAAAIADLQLTIARWFAAAGLTQEAVQHLVALDDIPAAAALIESRLSDAFAREDWQSVASWLRSIPMEAVGESPELLLASAWVAYLSGRDALLTDILETMRGAEIWRRATPAQRAEIALLTTIPEADPIAAIEVAERAIAVIPSSKRYRYGYAHMALGMALTAAGREDEALARLAAFTERESARIDAASIRGYFARAIVLRQSGRLARCEQTAADLLQLAAMNGFPVSAGWGALILGAVAHERGDLAHASRHVGTVIADADRVHFICLARRFSCKSWPMKRKGCGPRRTVPLPGCGSLPSAPKPRTSSSWSTRSSPAPRSSVVTSPRPGAGSRPRRRRPRTKTSRRSSSLC